MSFFKRRESHIERYRRLRAAGKQLITKMYDAAKGPQYDIIRAAKKLTLPLQNRTLIFDGETDTTALADFYLHEMRFGGKRIVDVLADSGAELTPDERDEYETNIRFGNFIALIQAKARRMLKLRASRK